MSRRKNVPGDKSTFITLTIIHSDEARWVSIFQDSFAMHAVMIKAKHDGLMEEDELFEKQY